MDLTYQRLLMDSASIRLIERILDDHKSVTMANAAKDDKKTLDEIRKVIDQLHKV